MSWQALDLYVVCMCIVSCVYFIFIVLCYHASMNQIMRAEDASVYYVCSSLFSFFFGLEISCILPFSVLYACLLDPCDNETARKNR